MSNQNNPNDPNKDQQPTPEKKGPMFIKNEGNINLSIPIDSEKLKRPITIKVMAGAVTKVTDPVCFDAVEQAIEDYAGSKPKGEETPFAKIVKTSEGEFKKYQEKLAKEKEKERKRILKEAGYEDDE